MTPGQSHILRGEVTDTTELTKAQRQDERFARNWAWFEAHAAEIDTQYRGKCICIAGEELFVADTLEEVLRKATTVHPEDDGRFTSIIRKEKGTRVYVDRRRMAAV